MATQIDDTLKTIQTIIAYKKIMKHPTDDFSVKSLSSSSSSNKKKNNNRRNHDPPCSSSVGSSIFTNNTTATDNNIAWDSNPPPFSSQHDQPQRQQSQAQQQPPRIDNKERPIPKQPPGKHVITTDTFTPYSNIIQKYVNNGGENLVTGSIHHHHHHHQGGEVKRLGKKRAELGKRGHGVGEDKPIFGTSSIVDADNILIHNRYQNDNNNTHHHGGFNNNEVNNNNEEINKREENELYDDEEVTEGSISAITLDDDDEISGFGNIIMEPIWNMLSQYISPNINQNKNGNNNKRNFFNAYNTNSSRQGSSKKQKQALLLQNVILRLLLLTLALYYTTRTIYKHQISPFISRILQQTSLTSSSSTSGDSSSEQQQRPLFVYNHPYVTSSYYTSTASIDVLKSIEEIQLPKLKRPSDEERGIVSRLAILRPFCEFDAEALPTTFACWNSLVPCRAAEMDLGDEEDGEVKDEWVIFDMSTNGNGRKLNKDEEDDWECENENYANGVDDENEKNTTDSTLSSSSTWSFRGIANSLFKRCKRKNKKKEFFDDVPADGLRTTSADLFLFYSQTFSENVVSIKAVDEIMKEFFSVGGWCKLWIFLFDVCAYLLVQPEICLHLNAQVSSKFSLLTSHFTRSFLPFSTIRKHDVLITFMQ